MSDQPTGDAPGRYGDAPVTTLAGPPAYRAPDPVRQALLDVRHEVAKAVVGQEATVTGMLIALLSRGHVLLEGVPGVAKTLLVRALSAALSLDTKRVQFTPDLMPGDVTGSLVYDAANSDFSFREGPVFTNMLLADEINRTPPKTQASLLEAMEERQVSVEGTGRPLPEPFVVVATQNPVEYEGTYPLPEAQLDRFMLELRVNYPTKEDEERIVEQTTGATHVHIRPVLDARTLHGLQDLVRRIPVSKGLIKAAVRLARMTRPADADAPALVKQYVEWGAGPRASQYLVLGAKARAALDGRPMADLDDVRSVALSVLRHRVVSNFAAEAADRTSEDLIAELLSSGWDR